ncbi:MAG: hypothetical protein GF383_12145 [Candidatus Lokiarchaeota archaeon]|nr:hypothetical protein [Candidatus Lokiarchaeota archaeon]MBD3341694.1 hypothetical protein [Candidatus Lokiarchaeota archaeon]
MSEEENKKNKIHGLILFKEHDLKIKEEEKERITFEDVDQENKIKLHYDLNPFAANYKYSLNILNESIAPITEIKARVKFPHNLELIRYSPNNINLELIDSKKKDSKQANFEIDQLSGNNNTQINFHFRILKANDGAEISTYISFVNNKDFVRVLNADPINVPMQRVSIAPKIIPSGQITPFLKVEGIKKAVKSIGVGTEKDFNLDLFFNHINQILRSYEFQLIARDESKRISWFFGTEIKVNEDILIIGQVNQNKVEFLAASKNHEAIIILLTQLANEFKKHIISIGDIVNSEDNFYDLECKNCGNILPRFPKKGETIECPKCNKEQLVW